uniref:Uncharacterized protein LOC105036290 n=1 Tax=Elaeis guineensis var. tenera TaxID=51953 RepID=A0A6I9QLP0_ELAGV|nr:uncharacterized protein LOC105036290 [Elaeis guineensis]
MGMGTRPGEVVERRGAIYGGDGGGGREREGKVPVMRLPRGYRFDPKPWELIEYLQDKVEGRPDDGQGVINDVDVYGCSPKQLVDMVGDLIPCDGGSLFFFTSIEHRNGNCRDRSTPDGHWKSTKKMTRIRNGEGRLVGYRQDLCYFHGKKKPERTEWLMKEHILDHQQPKMALCEIYSAQKKCKGQIQGNEWRIQPLKDPTDSESENTQHHYSSNDWSSLGNGTEQRAGPSGGGFLSSSEGFPSAPGTSAGYLSASDGYTWCNSAVDVSDLAQDSLDLYAPPALDVPSQESPTVHADAAFKEGGSAKAAAHPDMLPDINAPEMWLEN